MRRPPVRLLFLPVLFALGIHPAFAATSFIDLSKAANMGPAQSFDEAVPGGEALKEKEGLANIPQGAQTLRGIPFSLLEAAANQGRSFVVLKGRRKGGFPEAVAINAGGIKAGDLYFLHSCRWGGTASNITVAEYDVIYADGQVEVVPLRVGQELTNFSGSDDTPASYLAWWHKYKNIDMGLNLLAWKNPLPDIPIQTILFKSLNKAPVPMLFGITASDTELPISSVSPKPEKTFQTDTKDWMTFEPSNSSPAGTAIDMSFLLDAPAGKHGALQADGDRLKFKDGTPARFWGTRLGNRWETMNQEESGELCTRLAAWGFNLVEADAPSETAQGLPAGFQGLMQALKAKGIYVVLNGDEKTIPPDLLADPAVIPQSLLSWGGGIGDQVTMDGSNPATFRDSPVVLDPAQNPVIQGISHRTLGTPYGFEWSGGWPNEYLAEMPFLVSAYSSSQDWDASLGMEIAGGGETTALTAGSSLEDKPQLWVQEPAAALAFLRGDLKPGRLFVLKDGAAPLAALAHRSGVEPEGGKDKSDPAGLLKAKISEKTKTIVSDTEQIRWQGNVGLVQVSSPRFQAAIGFLGHQKLSSPVWQVETPNSFASLSLISLTKTNLWASDHMLLTGVTRMENSGQVYNAAKTKLISAGNGPILVEPLQAKITLFRYKADPHLQVRALDANGQILNTRVKAKWAKNNLVFSWIPGAFYLEVFKKQ